MTEVRLIWMVSQNARDVGCIWMSPTLPVAIRWSNVDSHKLRLSMNDTQQHAATSILVPRGPRAVKSDLNVTYFSEFILCIPYCTGALKRAVTQYAMSTSPTRKATSSAHKSQRNSQAGTFDGDIQRYERWFFVLFWHSLTDYCARRRRVGREASICESVRLQNPEWGNPSSSVVGMAVCVAEGRHHDRQRRELCAMPWGFDRVEHNRLPARDQAGRSTGTGLAGGC